MRRIVSSLSFLSLAILLVAAVCPTARGTEYSYARIVRLSLVSGDVQVSRGGHSGWPASAGWEQALPNMPVEQGFTIGTTNGRAEVQFEDGATIWIAENTVVQFTELALSDGGRITHLTMGRGTLTAFANVKSADSFTITASQAQASVAKHALFRMDAFKDGASISVDSGSIEVNSPTGTKTVPKGETFAFNTKNSETAALRPNPKSDSWDRWVTSRENRGATESAQAASYANAPFSYGMADLAAYGSWGYFPGYGYGWQPMGMGNCWSPFMDGQWDSYPGLGWTWDSYEPWGWVPYHFGDWNYSPAYGWMWMPGDFSSWNPAPVQWYDASNQIGWSPEMAFTGPSQGFLTGFGGIGGCGGGSGYYSLPGQFKKATSGKSKTPVTPVGRGKNPIPPRFVLTTGKQLGHGGPVRILAAGGSEASIQAMPAPPLENGKFAFSSGEMSARNSAQASRVIVPTAKNLGQVRANLRLSANGSAAAPIKLSSAPMPAAIPVMASLRNGAPTPASMPRPPTPMRAYRAPSNPGMGGGFSPGSGSRYSAPSFSAPRMRPSAPAAPHVAAGKPH